MRLLIILISILPLSIFSQEIPENHTNFGAYIGFAQVGAISVEDLPDGHDIGGVGTFPNIGISKGIIVGPMPLTIGIGLGHRGYSYASPFGDSEVSADYLDFMVGTGYPVGPVNLTSLLVVGTSMGSGTIKSGDNEADIDEDFGEDTDYGIMFGLNYWLNDNISLDTGYYIGLAEIGEGGAERKFVGLTFSMGYKFQF